MFNIVELIKTVEPIRMCDCGINYEYLDETDRCLNCGGKVEVDYEIDETPDDHPGFDPMFLFAF